MKQWNHQKLNKNDEKVDKIDGFAAILDNECSNYTSSPQVDA